MEANTNRQRHIEYWYKVWEHGDNGHQTGRWQWAHDVPSGARFYFPQHWMFADAICAPPGVGTARQEELVNGRRNRVRAAKKERR